MSRYDGLFETTRAPDSGFADTAALDPLRLPEPTDVCDALNGHWQLFSGWPTTVPFQELPGWVTRQQAVPVLRLSVL